MSPTASRRARGEVVDRDLLRDGRERWHSRPLSGGDRELAFFPVTGGGQLNLVVQGPKGAFTNWGGAKFTCNDPETVR